MNRTGSKGLGTEGLAGVEHLSTVAMVALVGLVGFATFGEAAETAIAGQTPSAATSSAALGTPGGPALTGQGAEAPPHGYTVQVVAYNTPEEAADYAQYLRDNFGVDAFAEPNEHGYYVVRVGNPGTPEEAENLRQDLLALGVPADTYVEQHSGTLTPGQVEFLEAVAEQEAAAEAEAAEAEVTEAPETEQPEAEEGDSGGGEDCSWYDAFC
ncbi:MAG: SPOR domain-containing protein, partial [Myxococcales bacterium]|nr:SPOR domain-containing protein [Myxococcales bacterium]